MSTEPQHTPPHAPLHIEGIGRVQGGSFTNVTIEGRGVITGNTSCQSWTCNGSAKHEGNLLCHNMKVDGIASIHGHTAATSLHVDGRLAIEQSLTAQQIHIDGSLTVQGNCEAEAIFLDGLLRINGLLNADNIDIVLAGRGQAQEIGGEHINIKGHVPSQSQKLLSHVIPALGVHFLAKQIEGDHVYLEHTSAGIVRGHRVTIGPGCQIDRVEYKEYYVRHEHAVVGTAVQID